MKFSEMHYTRPDIDALLAQCAQLAQKAAAASSGEELVLRAERRFCRLYHRRQPGEHPLYLRHPG